MIWVIFWNIIRMNIFFFSIQNMKNNCYIIFLNFFPVIFSWWKMYFLPLIFIYKWFNFVVFCGFLFISFWFNATVPAYIKHLSTFLLPGFIVAFLFFIQSGESIYDPPWLGFFYDIFNAINEHNQKLKSLPFTDSKLFW